uniref:Bifunctional inhibitor/plant lipid transfer protein/seed storage helical domain-containing protein n=1 Tax=Aegilops tauschii TaxID=37682 RepID=M8B3B6_AEGTA
MALAAAQRQRSASAVLVAAVLLSLSLSLSCVQAQAPHVAVPPSAPPKAAAAPGPAGGLSAACLNSLGIAVDYARALALPGVCRVATPPITTCAAMGYNVRLGPSPAPAPGSPSPMSPGGSPQYPAGPSPFASPPESPKPSHAARRFHAAGALVALAASFAVGMAFF